MIQETSLKAFGSVQGALPGMKHRIVQEVVAADGLTCDEVEQRLGLKHQSASACIRALVKEGVLTKTPDRRPTRSDRDAIVWRVAA